MASAINPISSQSTPGLATSGMPSTGTAPTKELFLQLLVAQIKNQDPLNPDDGMQFVSQLAQFSELEQMIAIHNGVDAQVEIAQSQAAQSQNGQIQTSGTQTGGTDAGGMDTYGTPANTKI